MDNLSIWQIMDSIQFECHKFVEKCITEKVSISYQDATNTFMFLKLAELQNRIEYLEKINKIEG